MTTSDFKFIFSNRAEVGLVDVYDLSEIFTSDQRFALSNLSLDPDGLDQIYKLSSGGLSKEDIRTMGGLETRVIDSLAISDGTLSNVSFDLSTYITTDKSIGEPEKQSFSNDAQSDNIIVFNGGIAAKKIEYNFLDENGELRTTTVPTSRESLFSSERNAQDQYSTVSYQGLFRIRRRSHIYQLSLSSKILIPKNVIIESPTDRLNLPVYMRTSGNTNPAVTTLQCYATKNSPIVVPVKIFNTGTVTISRLTASATAFVYGWELKRASDLAFVRGSTVNSANVSSVSITLNLAGTIGNGVNCLLYIYLDPAAVNGLDLSGLGVTELSGGQDLGLVGFNDLRSLTIASNQISTLPVWLKTLHDKLESLNIRDNAFWNNGIVSHFDYQDMSGAGITGADTSQPVPSITLTQVLGYSGWTSAGAISGYDGSYATAADVSSPQRLYKDARKNSIAGTAACVVDLANGFRPFTRLTNLNLGPTVRLVNPDFSRLFPVLRTISIDAPSDQSPKVYWGLIPKMKNNLGTMSLNLFGHDGKLGGSIKYLGDTLEWRDNLTAAQKQEFIGQFKFSAINFNCRVNASFSGGICTGDDASTASVTLDGKPKYHHMATTGGTATPSLAWSGWLAELQDIRISRNDIAFRIASGSSLNWAKLRYSENYFCGEYGTSNKIEYNRNVSDGDENATDILTAGQLENIEAWRSGWWGKIFSIRSANRLFNINVGNNDWIGYKDSDDREYILPRNFAVTATSSNFSGLRSLYLHWLINGPAKNLEFRQDDLKNLPKLNVFYLVGGYYTGRFPDIYTDPLSNGVRFNTWIEYCRFRDVSALGSAVTSRVEVIYAPNQGAGTGGCLSPNFKSLSTNTILRYVDFRSSLPSNYPGNWENASLRNKPIGSVRSGATAEITTTTVLWTSRNNRDTQDRRSDKLYHSSPGAYSPFSQVMVGDIVTGDGIPGGTRVTQIGANGLFIHVNIEVDIKNTTLSFQRTGQDISTYFDNHRGLDELYLTNFRLTGTIPRFVNCTTLRFVDLNQNMLSDYVIGTLKNITGVTNLTNSSPRLRRVNLRSNALTVKAVRDIISDLFDIAVYFKQKNITPSIDLLATETKFNTSTGFYQNYTKAEIFNQSSTTTNSAGQTITIQDPLETKFNQLGTGRLYPGIRPQIF